MLTDTAATWEWLVLFDSIAPAKSFHPSFSFSCLSYIPPLAVFFFALIVSSLFAGAFIISEIHDIINDQLNSLMRNMFLE